ncbi:hypothetical protein BXZ70DRAFT_167614 [Cristinia sonorae]|uniref:ditrans,polycis-polyprenyl diphosphate synthase [(2E,6E)-farnesyldiphosphate specific] n=1 Tax=Cristinia sonorae TaxID=1940300 RepID=A0A8K0UPY0_9AGAR|nr:hypothetical protein BXZ70DRAFT_167614 [Cristinia sonorae]
MSWLTYAALYFIHALYTAYRSLLSYRSYFNNPPQVLNVPRKKLPKHLALLIIPDEELSAESCREAMVQNVELLTSWCKDAGIERLTVYDREGILNDSAIEIQDRLRTSEDSSNSSAESEPEYPLTPPLSDVSESRTLTPEIIPPPLQLHTIHIPSRPRAKRHTRNVVKRRKPAETEKSPEAKSIALHLICRATGKPALARVAQHFLQVQRQSKASVHILDSIDDVGVCLEGERGLSPPDLMIVHDMASSRRQRPLELHGFPPWQMRLTEFRQTKPAPRFCAEGGKHATALLDEAEFVCALDEFSCAEMRLGK